MNICLLNAGGKGERIGNEIPKQFLEVNNIPIIIYTLKIFQDNKDIDEIDIVCIKGWEDKLLSLCKEYNIDKLKYIITGGETAQDSRYNGLKYLYNIYKENDHIVIIHDANRPLVKSETISKLVSACKEFKYTNIGYKVNADVMHCDKNNFLTPHNFDSRGNAVLQMPCAYYLDTIYNAYENNKDIFYRTSGPSEMITNDGIDFHKLVECSYLECFKITHPEDLEFFSKYLEK